MPQATNIYVVIVVSHQSRDTQGKFLVYSQKYSSESQLLNSQYITNTATMDAPHYYTELYGYNSFSNSDQCDQTLYVYSDSSVCRLHVLVACLAMWYVATV